MTLTGSPETRHGPIGRVLLVCMAVILLAGCASKPPPLRTSGPTASLADLVGSWEIDYKNTEDPQSKLAYLYEIAQSQYEQAQRMQTEMPQASQSAMKAVNDLQGVVRLGKLAKDEVTHSTVLTISQSDGLITIKRSHDYALVCDFLAPVSELKIGQESCGFDQNGRLVFEAMLPEGLTVINRFALAQQGTSDDDKRLLVQTIFASNKYSKPFVLNRVYMMFPPGAGMYKCQFTLEKKKSCWLGNDQGKDQDNNQASDPPDSDSTQ